MNQGHCAELLRFPDRSTVLGRVINSYLTNKTDLDARAAHLLFSANRWELEPLIRSKIESGVTLVVDRYAFSGICFTAAKVCGGGSSSNSKVAPLECVNSKVEQESARALECINSKVEEEESAVLEWCKNSDRGLPRPDLVLFLDLETSAAAKRGGYGQERFENEPFQSKVRALFLKLSTEQDINWQVVESDKTKEQLHQDIKRLTETILNSESLQSHLGCMWLV